MILSPFTPLLFMGEENGETAPFLYFTSHGDPALVEAVHEGRREEFSAFAWKGEAPHPQAEETFARSRVQHDLVERSPHREMRALYRALLEVRSGFAGFATDVVSWESPRVMVARREGPRRPALLLFSFDEGQARLRIPVPPGEWGRRLDSADRLWCGPGSPLPDRIESDGRADIALAPNSFAVFVQETS